MSISNEIERLQNAKASIKTAIENKGVEVGEGLIDSYASKIDEIQVGGDTDKYIDILEGNVTNFSESKIDSLRQYAFYNDQTLLSVDMPNVETIGNYAFFECKQIKSLNIPKIKVIGNNVFHNCSQLKTISDISELTSIGISCFASCTRLEGDINLPKLISLTQYGFSSCQNISNFKGENITEVGHYAFSNCKKMETVTIPKLMTAGNSSFSQCLLITNFDFPELTTVGTSCFNRCEAVKVFDFPKLSSVNANCFVGCINLKALVLRNSTLVTLVNTSAFNNNTPILNGTGYVYVPRSLIESYKTGTNWVTFADQFRAIEDYTLDGTVTGELNFELMGVEV